MRKQKSEGNISDSDLDENDLMKKSLLTVEESPSAFIRVMTKLDFFSFLPVPRQLPVSSFQSILGSFVFILLFLTYISIQFYQFVNDNPPKIQSYTTKLDDKFYQLPRIAVGFQEGQYLDISQTYQTYFNFTFTKENKTKQTQNKTTVPLVLNDQQNVEWLSNQTTDFYKYLRSPSEPMKAKGLLYSTNECNYTKLSISMCNVSNPDVVCQTQAQIRNKTAQGRVFLFIQDTLNEVDQGGPDDDNEEEKNRFLISNFFLMPRIYKRVTVSFTVVKTTIYPDYFNRFSPQTHTKLNVNFITEQTSNVTENSLRYGIVPVEMLGITFQLSPQVTNIRMSYDTIFDQVAKWGAFFNVLFTLFAILFLQYNRRKFYKRNPDWDRFKKHMRQRQRSN